MLGTDILKRAKEHIGERYILGARAPLENSSWRGPWDCAEYCSWLAYQTYGVVFGCGSKELRKADPYSGFWADEAENSGRKVSAAAAARTPGAFLIRKPVTTPSKQIGHVAIAIGDGRVYEAAGARLGVRIGPIEGRRWDLGVLLPGVEYTGFNAVDDGPTAIEPDEHLILRQQEQPVFDERVSELQIALKAHGFDPGRVDGLFGPLTEASVYCYQLSEGLLPDGEVGPETGSSLDLAYWERRAAPKDGQQKQATKPGSDGLAALPSDEFGAVVSKATDFDDIGLEYQRLFQTCQVEDKRGEIAELSRRIRLNQVRYQNLVETFDGRPAERMPWFFVALVHAMEASGDIGTFKTHLHNGDSLTRPTVHVPKHRPTKNGSNFTWEQSARDALQYQGYTDQTEWSLGRMLYLLEKYNGMGPRRKGHATAYLWSYSNHYKRGKYIADNVWSDEAVSKQPGAASILKHLVDDGVVAI